MILVVLCFSHFATLGGHFSCEEKPFYGVEIMPHSQVAFLEPLPFAGVHFELLGLAPGLRSVLAHEEGRPSVWKDGLMRSFARFRHPL